jgi:hypothetical protein
VALGIAAVLSCTNPTDSANRSFGGETTADTQVDSPSGAAAMGILELFLKDFPLQGQVVENVWIEVMSVEARTEAAGWISVFDDPAGTDLDLLELAGEPAHLSSSELPEGRYSQVRLRLGGDNRIVVAGLGEFPLKIPSGQQSGIKIIGEFEIRDGYRTTVLLDFDAEQSVKLTGNGRYQLRPTIRIEEATSELVKVDKEPAAEPASTPPGPGFVPAVVPAVTYLVIDTFYPDGGGLSDTYVRLLDGSGALLAEDDDGNPLQSTHDGYSRIEVPGGLPAGTYYVRITNDSGTGSPYYGIRILDYDDPEATFPTLATVNENDGGSDDAMDANGLPIAPVEILLGDDEAQSRAVFPVVTDVDWFSFVLE